MKKHWVVPQLVVLVSGKAEEAVLVPCKAGQFTGLAVNGSPITANATCTNVLVGPGLTTPACSNCNSIAIS
jgi:hypothetical protein